MMKSISIVLGILLFATLSFSEFVAAGTFEEVYVDDILVPSTNNCYWLQQGSSVEGLYSPENPYDADIDWQLNSGSWHDAGTMGGGTGDVAFWFTMSEYAGIGSVLRIRATEVIPNPDIIVTWWCYK